MPPRKGPAPPQRRAPRNANYAGQFSAQRAGDGYATPTAEDRAVDVALELLRENGYIVAARCLDCRHPIYTESSLARMRGSRCAARHTETQAAGETLAALRVHAVRATLGGRPTVAKAVV